jgi:hypothetical protein
LRSFIGSPGRFYFSESDPDSLVGYSRVLKYDDREKMEEKLRYAFVDNIWKVVLDLQPHQFEMLCGGLLLLEGFEVLLTKRNGGADLFAKDYQENLYLGQSRHFSSKDEQIPPSNLRELLGAVEDWGQILGLKAIPVLFTTANVICEGLRIAKSHKMLVYDGEKIVYLIAKYKIGFIGDLNFEFNKSNFLNWLESLSIKRATKGEIQKWIRPHLAHTSSART